MEDKRKFIAWIKSHKKQLIIAGISITTLIVIVVGIKNKSEIIKLWGALQEKIKRGGIYSSKWLETATDLELDLEREKIRVAYCSSGTDNRAASLLQNLLWRFDQEISKRAWGNKTPHAPTIHREHGWYLTNNE
ncbi:MAG: hypothetical protein E7547_07830 [Ruminococcaceae bacterium]|nr:hypothetical protein [Oscillospiraceae bacterium]